MLLEWQLRNNTFKMLQIYSPSRKVMTFWTTGRWYIPSCLQSRIHSRLEIVEQCFSVHCVEGLLSFRMPPAPEVHLVVWTVLCAVLQREDAGLISESFRRRERERIHKRHAADKRCSIQRHIVPMETYFPQFLAAIYGAVMSVTCWWCCCRLVTVCKSKQI